MLKLKVIKGVGWSVSSRLFSRVIDLATLLILARILVPADFGLTALAFSIVSILDMVLEIPIVQALTRLRTLDKGHYDTAFTLGLIRGLAFAAITLAAAWPFSQFYHDDRLFALVAVLAIAPVARSLYSPRMVDQMRELRFAPVFAAQVAGKIFAAGLALWTLFAGGGYWAIAVNNVAAASATTAITYLFAPYRPALSLVQFKDFSGFMGWFSLSQVIAALNWQFDRFVLGAGVSKSELGQYTMAGDLAVMPTQSLIGPAMQPILSAFSKLTDDPERLRNAFLRAGTIMMMISAPICILIFSTADWITEILFNNQWANVSTYLAFLALTVIPVAYYQVFYSMALSVNRASVVFRMNCIDLASRLVMVPAGLYLYDVMGVILARGAAAVLLLLLCLHFAKALIGVRVVDQLGGLAKVAAACFAMSLCLFFCIAWLEGHAWNPVLEILIAVTSGGLVYLIALYFLGAAALVTDRLADPSPEGRPH